MTVLSAISRFHANLSSTNLLSKWVSEGLLFLATIFKHKSGHINQYHQEFTDPLLITLFFTNQARYYAFNVIWRQALSILLLVKSSMKIKHLKIAMFSHWWVDQQAQHFPLWKVYHRSLLEVFFDKLLPRNGWLFLTFLLVFPILPRSWSPEIWIHLQETLFCLWKKCKILIHVFVRDKACSLPFYSEKVRNYGRNETGRKCITLWTEKNTNVL